MIKCLHELHFWLTHAGQWSVPEWDLDPEDDMIVRPLTLREIKEILARQDEIYRHQPSCPSCSSQQVQIMFTVNPARWRCRECKRWFTSEPSESPTQSKG